MSRMTAAQRRAARIEKVWSAQVADLAPYGTGGVIVLPDGGEAAEHALETVRTTAGE